MSVHYEDYNTALGRIAAQENGPAVTYGDEIHAQPVHEYTAREVKAIRKACGLTQVMFAAFLGVSVKTVEAWERGRNSPTGPASRLLSFAEKEPGFPYSSGILSVRREYSRLRRPGQ